MTTLTHDEVLLLRIIGERDGQLNWYRIGHAHLHRFESPGSFDAAFKRLQDLKLIESRKINDEPLDRLFLTEAGRLRFAEEK